MMEVVFARSAKKNRTYARCDRKPYSCVAVIHELPLRRVMFYVSPEKLTISSEQLVLTDSETLDKVLECLAENFSIETQGAYDQQRYYRKEIFYKGNG